MNYDFWALLYVDTIKKHDLKSHFKGFDHNSPFSSLKSDNCVGDITPIPPLIKLTVLLFCGELPRRCNQDL